MSDSTAVSAPEISRAASAARSVGVASGALRCTFAVAVAVVIVLLLWTSSWSRNGVISPN